MASPTRWTWVWVNSRSWWQTGRPGVLWFMGSQGVGHDWATELNWTEGILITLVLISFAWGLIICYQRNIYRSHPDISPVDLQYVSQSHFFTKVWITTLCSFYDAIKITYSCYYLLLTLLLSSHAKSCLTLCDPINCSTPGFPVLHYLLEFPQTHVLWVSDAIQPFHSLLPPSPPALNIPQHQGLFLMKRKSFSVLHVRWPKYWSFSLSFSISPANEFSELISFMIDWFDLLAVQGTLKSLL